MNLKVFFTGGTIGSTAKNGVIGTDDESAPRLIKLYREFSGDNRTVFDCETLFGVLSENLELSHLKKLIEAIEKVYEDEETDGIVITHGTDTLLYTANFLSFMLYPYKLPVFLVSSNKPLDEPGANGVNNLNTATHHMYKHGVFVALDKAYGGTELTEAMPFRHTFRSINRENKAFMPVPRFPERKNIVFLKTYPGLDYRLRDFREWADAVLIETYHSGTAKTVSQDGTENIIDFAKSMKADGIPVYAAPFDTELGFYESSAAMKEAGIIFLPDITAITAYVKLQIAYGSFDNEAERAKFLGIISEQ
jgi:L-asparaginase